MPVLFETPSKYIRIFYLDFQSLPIENYLLLLRYCWLPEKLNLAETHTVQMTHYWK